MREDKMDAPNCGREADLIAFLYDELDEGEKESFHRHMQGCPSCSAELTAFTDIRESVVSWRNESLVGVSAPAAVGDSAVTTSGQRRPSALAALREFFDLSPLWMKGAVAFASLLFCIFAVLAVARLREMPPTAVVASPNGHSESELNELVERRVQDELQRIKNSGEAPIPPVVVEHASQHDLSQGTGTRRRELAASGPDQGARRPLSKVEREELATDLRLISAKNDSEIDLLDDRINH